LCDPLIPKSPLQTGYQWELINLNISITDLVLYSQDDIDNCVLLRRQGEGKHTNAKAEKIKAGVRREHIALIGVIERYNNLR
jgi:hypothetical protein